MSVQIALGAPATRVASRKLGPVAGSRSPPAASARAAWETSTLASTCGRCETVARIVSWVVGVDRRRPGARARAAAGAGARRARPRCVAVGVRYQVAPSNRSARACSTPGGLGAGQRVAADEPRVVVGGDHGALGRADVGDHAVLGRRRQRRRRPAPASCADRHGHEHRVGAGDGLARRSSQASSSAPRPQRRRSASRRAVEAAHRGAQPLAGGQRRSSRRSARRR